MMTLNIEGTGDHVVVTDARGLCMLMDGDSTVSLHGYTIRFRGCDNMLCFYKGSERMLEWSQVWFNVLYHEDFMELMYDDKYYGKHIQEVSVILELIETAARELM